MYNLEILPIAKKDMDEIIYYISHNLKNIIVSRKLLEHFIKAFDSIIDFPYGYSVYQSGKTLENEYRIFRVKNFLMFYTINEKEKVITIVRVLYQKMDVSEILE